MFILSRAGGTDAGARDRGARIVNAGVPAFMLYARDWLTDEVIRNLTLEERGFLVELLCHMWLNGGLPPDLPAQIRQTSIEARRYRRLLRAVRPLLAIEDNRLIYPPMEVRRRELADVRKHQSEQARKAAHARWQQAGGRDAARNADALLAASMEPMRDALPARCLSTATASAGTRDRPAAGIHTERKRTAEFKQVAAIARDVRLTADAADGEADIKEDLKRTLAGRGLSAPTDVIRKALDATAVALRRQSPAPFDETARVAELREQGRRLRASELE